MEQLVLLNSEIYALWGEDDSGLPLPELEMLAKVDGRCIQLVPVRGEEPEDAE